MFDVSGGQGLGAVVAWFENDGLDGEGGCFFAEAFDDSWRGGEVGGWHLGVGLQL